MALRTPLTAQPHLYIGDSTGRPLDYGRVYFGEPNKDPEFYPIDIYLDPEMTIAAAQPVRTKGGFMDVGGDLAELHAAEVVYSLKVLDQYGRQVFYKPEMYRNNVSDFLVDEITRATTAETLIAGNLTAETQRAIAAEKVIADAVVAEKDRAVAAEDALDIKHAALSSTINSLGGGKKAYTTYALMVADKNNIAANSSIDVTNDTDPLRNGTYSYDGAVFAKSIYDVETIVRTKVLNTFKTKSLMDASALPDGADAQVTDDTVNNGLYVKTAGAWVESDYDPVRLNKEFTYNLLGEKVLSIDESGLIDKNRNHLGISNSGYDSTGFIYVEEGDKLIFSAQLFASGSGNGYTFYDIERRLISNADISKPRDGYYTEQLIVPRGAVFFKIMTANSSRDGYVAGSFKLERITFRNSKKVRHVDAEYFDTHSTIGDLHGPTNTTHSTLTLLVNGSEYLSYKGLQAVGGQVADIVVHSLAGEPLMLLNTPEGHLRLHKDAGYLVISTRNETHPDFNSIVASELEITIKQSGIDSESLLPLSWDGLVYASSDFKHTADFKDSSGRISTGLIPTKYAKHLAFYIYEGEVLGFNSEMQQEVLFKWSSEPNKIFAGTVTIPRDIDYVAVSSSANLIAKEKGFQPLAVAAKTKESLQGIVAKELNSKVHTGFTVKNTFGVAPNSDYDSTEFINVVKGSVIKFNVDGGTRDGIFFPPFGASVLNITKGSNEFVAPQEGFVILSTKNSSSPNYNPEFIADYTVIHPSQVADNNMGQNTGLILGEYLPTPILKAVREVSFNDGTPRMAIQYLWYDAEWNFYISNSLRGQKQFIFKWDSDEFNGIEPHHLGMNFDKFGNIVCVFRIEQLSYSLYSDDSRKNPFILIKDAGYKSVTVDFGESLKPSAWLQNCGFLCTDDAIYIVEYTRPSVKTANAWKATYPLTEVNNWKTIQSFELSPEQSPADNLKHMHSIEKDPFTGFIYSTTGDNNAGAAMYVTKDKGATIEKILDGSEKYCRVLNFVFTKDWVYWATDSTGSRHWLFKAPRDADGVIDVANITDLQLFPYEASATYATIHLSKIDALLFLGRADRKEMSVTVDIWDLRNNTMSVIDTIPVTDGVEDYVGFRCETFEYCPRGNEVACGFSVDININGYENHNGILGNTDDKSKKVGNIVLTVDRIGGDFTISYDTVL